MKGRSWRIVSILLAFSILVSVSGCEAVDRAGLQQEKNSQQMSNEQTQDSGNAGELQVHFIDVGQGDSTLITCDGHAMLIDAGNNDKGTLVQNYIKKQGVKTLDYVIGTHPDADHIGGLDVIIYKYECKQIFLPPVDNDTKTYAEVLSAIEERNYTYSCPEVGSTFYLGEAEFTLVAPNRDYGEDTNNWSIVLLLQNGSNRFLFTGDAEEDAEADMLENGIDLSADVLKVSHHGSSTATTQKFLDSVNPSYAVISVGADNRYGHPHAEVMNRLREKGVKVFRTDEQGSLIATSDGSKIAWNAGPEDSWKAGEATGSTSGETDEGTVENECADEDTDVIAYILNTNTKKFHTTDCSAADQMAEKNRQEVDWSRDDVIAAGYEPCKLCNP